MTQKTDKLGFLIVELLAPKIIELTQENMEDFGVVSVIEAKVTSDYNYADIFISSQKNTKELTKFLAKHESELKSIVSRNVSIRKIPKLRFRLPKAIDNKTDVLKLINELSNQYGFNKES